MQQQPPGTQHRRYILVLATAIAPLSVLAFYGLSLHANWLTGLLLAGFGYVITLALASVLLRHFVLRDVETLRDDIDTFRMTGDLPEVDPDEDPETDGQAARQAFRELAEEQLVSQARLEHAETLQREVFHRVSNNFQIIQSMIRLIARDKAVRNPTSELETRIQLLSIAHHAHHKLDDVDMRPLRTALPAMVSGVKSAGFLKGADIALDIDEGAVSVQRSYALLHIAIEGLRALDHAGAQHVKLMLKPGVLSLTADTQDTKPSQTSARLCSAFAQELKGKVIWDASGLKVEYTPSDPATDTHPEN